MEKDYNIAVLCDIYGSLLTERQREIISLYYNLDNSLGEIADEFSISRQSVRDTLVSAKNSLNAFESKLKLKCKRERISQIANKANGGDLQEVKNAIKSIVDIVEE